LVSQGAVWAVTLLLLVVAESAYCIPSCAACDKDVQCDRVNDCPNPNGQLRCLANPMGRPGAFNQGGPPRICLCALADIDQCQKQNFQLMVAQETAKAAAASAMAAQASPASKP